MDDVDTSRSRRRVRSPIPLMLLFAVLVGVPGAAGVIRAADSRTGNVERIEGLERVLTEVVDDGPSVNYLLVGSDSRDGADPDADDFGAIGTLDDVQGQRADTIMILRRDEDGGVALTSLPRDLWVPIAGTGRSGRINAAYNEGPERLAATVTEALGIPIHHYVEVDFFGFKDIIDAVGGVDLCVEYVTRDTRSGLALDPGCQTLDGTMALAFARSRYYEEFRDGQWRVDGSADLGRIRRQQLFMRAAINGAILEWRSSPFSSSRLIDSVTSSVRIDNSVDPLRAADSLRRAAEEDLVTYVLPVRGVTRGDAQVLELEPAAEEILDYFRGLGPAPAVDPDA
ncbi:MAG: LytR family transcriptional regulator [Ilumatobacter sp.]|nr:MAG: LytR family transcriptional regulator [Ilumatobacter sp.]